MSRADGAGDTQEPGELHAVKAEGGAFGRHFRPADVGGRVAGQDFLEVRVPVEASDGAEPPADRRRVEAAFEGFAGVELNVRAAGLEDREVMLVAPFPPL